MDLSQIRQQLSERKTLLEARAEKTERDASHRDAPLPADFAEQATERENDDVLRAIAGESVHEIELINQALVGTDGHRMPTPLGNMWGQGTSISRRGSSV